MSEGDQRARASTVGAWIRAARPLAFGNIGLPIAAGAVWAHLGIAGDRPSLGDGAFSLRGLLLALVWGVLAQLWIVFSNDYADRDADGLGPGSLVSGGSRVLVRGEISPTALRRAAGTMALLLLASAWPLSFALGGGSTLLRTGPGVTVAGAGTLALTWAYSYPPIRASYRNGGALLQGVGVGIGLPIVGALFQGFRIIDDAARFPWGLVLAGAALATAGNWMTALPDAVADQAAGKRTRVVRKGGERVRVEAVALSALAGLALSFQLTTWLSPLQLALAATIVGVGIAVASYGAERPTQIVPVVVALAFNSAIWAMGLALALVAPV